MSPERLPPPVTITIPGRTAPADQPEPTRRGRSRSVALVAAAGLGLTLAGTSALTDPVPLPSSAQGVTAGATLASRPVRGATSVRLELLVQIGADRAAPGPERLTVVRAAGDGLVPTVAGEPSVEVGRQGGQLRLGADVQIDCSVPPPAARRLELVVRRGSRAQADVPVQGDVGVDRVLERIAARVCPVPTGPGSPPRVVPEPTERPGEV